MEDDDTPRDWNDIAGQEILGEDTSTSNTQDSESCASDDTNEPGHKFNFRMEKQLRSQRYHGSGRGPWGGDYKAHIKQGSWRGGVFEWEGWKADQERNRRTRQHDDGDSLSRRYLEELKRSGLTYYQVLGVSDNATIQDLRRAYRKMAFLYHPDRNMGDMAAEQRFRDIQKAFQTLSDPFRRAMYNETIKFTSISNQNQPQYQTNNSRDAATKTAGHLNPDEREPFPSI